MGNAKVIEFPKERSFRKRLQDKAQEQKSVLVMSIASVALMTVFVNQWLVDNSDSAVGGRGNREIASFEPGAFARDVKWEHDIAQKLSAEKSSLVAALAEKPTLRDDLIFGYLEGKYGMNISGGKIQSLEFIDAQAGEKALEIQNKASFLKKYASAFGLNFVEVSPVTSADAGEQVFSLIDNSKTIVGQAHFAIDQEGRVHSLRFTQ
ncbi:hypothetical protein ACLVWU_12995 [Bdellovibrio sp. HCB290]|uniref:hypothetical protein n=1 Tax=Bdellovibrio sp. HCB290 TaxID=3394356 RepID=UPI0039B377C9